MNTDFLGFSGDRPNGLLQQDIRFNWVLNKTMWTTKDIAEEDIDKKDHSGFQVFRYATFPYIVFNRIDKSKDVNYPVGLTLTNTPIPEFRPCLTTMDLWKYSNFQAGFKLNFFTYQVRRFRLTLDVGASLLRNMPYYPDSIIKLVDSTKTSSDLRAVHSFLYRAELNGQTLLDENANITMTACAGIMGITLRDDFYKQFDATIVDPFNRAADIQPVNNVLENRSATPIVYGSVVLEKKWGEHATNAGFFRINYYHQSGVYDRINPLNTTQNYQDVFFNHYLQMQLGVSFGLETIFKSPGSSSGTGKEKDKYEDKAKAIAAPPLIP